jgi:NDP-sugar pyrophosphorylase family protein
MTDGISLDRTAGLVLAGTHQWTQSAFDGLMPRTLLPVAHRPLISYALSWMSDVGINRIVVCGNRGTESLEPHLSRHVPSGAAISYVQDSIPRGAAGSLRDAAATIDADVFIVADGTSIPNIDLLDLLRAHRASAAAVTIVVEDEPRRNGNAELKVPTGIYVFERRALDMVPTTGFYDIKERLIPQLYRAGECVSPYCTSNVTPRVLSASTYLATNEWAIEQLERSAEVPTGFTRSGQAFIHRDARIAPDAVLVGPVIVSAGAHVKSQAVIVGPSSIGCDAIIEAGAFVSRTAVWRRAFIGESAVADRCLIADDGFVPPASHALQTVLTGVSTDMVRESGEPSAEVLAEVATFDWARRVGRLLSGGEWSRSPAAQ